MVDIESVAPRSIARASSLMATPGHSHASAGRPRDGGRWVDPRATARSPWRADRRAQSAEARSRRDARGYRTISV